jgi:hypothetical protein
MTVSCPGRGAACNAAPQSRDLQWAPALQRHSVSKTRVNALMALRSVRGTISGYPKCQSLISVTRSIKVRTLADNSREVG